jgi:hypothetical protein
MEAEAGRVTYACRMNIMARTKMDSRKEDYGASLAALFCASRQMTAVVQTVAVEKGLPWRTVPEVTFMLGDGRRETSLKISKSFREASKYLYFFLLRHDLFSAHSA